MRFVKCQNTCMYFLQDCLVKSTRVCFDISQMLNRKAQNSLVKSTRVCFVISQMLNRKFQNSLVKSTCMCFDISQMLKRKSVYATYYYLCRAETALEKLCSLEKTFSRWLIGGKLHGPLLFQTLFSPLYPLSMVVVSLVFSESFILTLHSIDRERERAYSVPECISSVSLVLQ